LINSPTEEAQDGKELGATIVEEEKNYNIFEVKLK